MALSKQSIRSWGQPPRYYRVYFLGGLATAVCTVLMFLLDFTDLQGIVLLLGILLLMLAPVFLDVCVWLDATDEASIS